MLWFDYVCPSKIQVLKVKLQGDDIEKWELGNFVQAMGLIGLYVF
jgi:hypothetical protein